MRNTSLCLLALTAALFAGVPGGGMAASRAASPAAPSDAEADAAYAAAQKAFQATAVNGSNNAKQTQQLTRHSDVPEVMVFTDPSREMVPGTADPKNIPLQEIRVVVDVENDSLRDIMHKVVGQAARYTGPWQVKWRLKPENAALLDERVNLTAEAKFGDFINLLTERVKNMSGVQLFVTTFNESRIIMVADTYY
jgi:hypothetical protein